MKISVYIPSYNQRRFLAEAIESVLAQTLPPHEIIVVDDCSTDGSQDVIAGYAARNPRLITAIYHDRRRGIPETRNHALQTVTGECVTYVDADDRLLPTKLEREAQALAANPDAHIVFSDFLFTDAHGAVTRRWAAEQKPPAGEVFREVLLRKFPTGNLFRAELVPCEALHHVGFYDTTLSIYSDWELRIRLTKRFRTVYVDEPLSVYRRHGAGVSDSPIAEHVRAWEQIWRKNCCLLDDLPPQERAELELEFAGLIVWKRVKERLPLSPAARCEVRSRQGVTPPGAEFAELDAHELAVRLQWAEQRLRETEEQRCEDSRRMAQAEKTIARLSQTLAELRSSKTYRRVSWGFPRLRSYVDALEATLESS
jgi:glycosyltransferase involved in cell wall biosynthesis